MATHRAFIIIARKDCGKRLSKIFPAFKIPRAHRTDSRHIQARNL